MKSRYNLSKLFLAILVTILVIAARFQTSSLTVPSTRRSLDESGQAKVLETYGRLPLSFEANQGQTDSQVRFISHGSGYNLFLTATEAVLTFIKPAIPTITDAKEFQTVERTILRLQLVGANPVPRVQGLEELPGKSNHLIGNDPLKWHTNIPNYARVKYQDVYPGVDVVYYGNQRQLEFDFVVAPGTDPNIITLAFQGADNLELDPQGNLILRISGGEVVQQAPIIYQEIDGVKQGISGGYLLKDDSQIVFEIAAYDATRPLIIDPVLAYSTYLGGADGDRGFDIAVDSAGNAYVTGLTSSADFPTASAIQGALNGSLSDVFVTKLNSTGNALVYSTYLGGSGNDTGFGIAVDSSGNAYVVGETGSSINFPIVNPLQPTFGGPIRDAFVAKLNPSGSALVYSTYLGGSDLDRGLGIAVDSSGNVYVTGETQSTDFPTMNPLQPVFGGAGLHGDAFLSKLDPTGSALIYSTYLGGSDDDIGRSIAVSAAGNAYVTGNTRSADFPVVYALQPISGGPDETFITQVNSTGSAFIYSTYLGGSRNEVGRDIAVDAAGNAYVTGVTSSSDFPTMNPLQPTNGGGSDPFLAKLNATGSALVFSTYLGGSVSDEGFGVAVDAAGSVYVTGQTLSTDFPTEDPIQVSNGGLRDAFVTKLNPAGNAREFSTYLGGSDVEFGHGIAVDAAGSIYVAGETVSADFPTVNPLQPAFGGGTSDGFVAKIADDNTGPLASNVEAIPNPVAVGNNITVSANVDDTAAGGSSIASAEFSIESGPFSSMAAADGTYDEVSEDVTANIGSFAEPAVLKICVRGTDATGNVGAEECIFLAIYDPEGGFVTGGGWIDSPEGAYAPDPLLTGRANFGFVSKYKKGAKVPTGQTEFQFQVADLNFHSEVYEWLVVAGPTAKFKGTGTINGAGNYGFMVTATDEELTPNTDVDLFRITIWDKDNNDTVIYDNKMGESDDSDAGTELGGGNIVIHKK